MLQSLASDKISEAEAVAAMYRNTTPTLLDVTQSEEKLNKLIQQHDVVIRWGYGYVEFSIEWGGGGNSFISISQAFARSPFITFFSQSRELLAPKDQPYEFNKLI